MWYFVLAMIVAPLVLVFVHGFVCGVRDGANSDSQPPAKEPSRARYNEFQPNWWMGGRLGGRFRDGCGDHSQN